MTSSDQDAWARLKTELRIWRYQHRVLTLWWRDDDATAACEALSRLRALTYEHPIGIAVIPALAEPSLIQALWPAARVLQHGVSHTNRAPINHPKNEFPEHLPLKDMMVYLRRGRQKLLSLLPQTLSVLVPPWNRLRSDLIPYLPELGYRGLSRFSRRPVTKSHSLIQSDTHIDIIEWGSRTFIGVEAALNALISHLQARRLGRVDPDEPTGLLTHHQAHDSRAWEFLQRLSAVIARHPHVSWVDPRALFSHDPIPV